jgi:Tfp pilus assembly protein PilN
MNTTINLIPTEREGVDWHPLLRVHIRNLLVFLCLCLIIGCLLLIVTRITLAAQYESLTLEASRNAVFQSEQVREDITDTLSLLDQVDKLDVRFTSWATIITELSGLIPEEARIHRLNLNQDGTMIIQGVSDTRAASLKLYEALQQAPFVSDVSNPLSNITQATDVEFEYRMRFHPPGHEL